MADGRIAVFGATGFVGRHLVQMLLRRRWRVRAAARRPDRLTVPSDLSSGLERVGADVRDEAAVEAVVAGVEAVVNLVGILTETPEQSYRAIHVEAARRIARAAGRHGAARLIHISALGAGEASPARSDRTKLAGEFVASEAFGGATIVRPSLIYGEDDHFFNEFAAMAARSPVLPLIGGGTTKFQPVAVDDVMAGLLALLVRPETAGRTYEFGGPEIFTFTQLLGFILAATKRRRILVPIPWSVAEVLAVVAERTSNPPLTLDQVRLLKTDKVLSGTKPTLSDLGVQPGRLQEFLPILREKAH
jgi:NADH dehydrogenase